MTFPRQSMIQNATTIVELFGRAIMKLETGEKTTALANDQETIMKEIIGTSNRILEVDLTQSKVDIYEVKPRERRLYLGGKGLGLKLLYDRLRPGADPLGEENIIAFMPGVLMGTGAP